MKTHMQSNVNNIVGVVENILSIYKTYKYGADEDGRIPKTKLAKLVYLAVFMMNWRKRA